MKILVATGSFKDVYSPIEVCKMIKDILCENNIVDIAPVCDGGEYTYDILDFYFDCKRESACNIINPYGKVVDVPYLTLNGEAYVISSEILHLHLDEDRYKNPMKLTDYGLGQVVKDAIDKKYKTINLCLGGTSTIGFGIGTAQALGVRFYDKYGEVFKEPLTPEQYKYITKMENNLDQYSDISINIINDGITKASHLASVNPLKIGRKFFHERENILAGIDGAFKSVLNLTGLSADDEYSGNGGGIYFGIENLFNTNYIKGAEYFCHLVNLDKYLEKNELVITGEGCFDNPHLKKIPIVVAGKAKEHGKKVLYICGKADKIILEDTAILQQTGIDIFFNCDEYRENIGLQENDIDELRRTTKEIFEKYLGENVDKYRE